MKHPDNNGFAVRAYGRQEIALKYFPNMTPGSAWRKLKTELAVNPRLCRLLSTEARRRRTLWPREVRMIVEELGEP